MRKSNGRERPFKSYMFGVQVGNCSQGADCNYNVEFAHKFQASQRLLARTLKHKGRKVR